MARGINKVILVGNLGIDPEVRYSQAGNAVGSLSIATSIVWRSKQTNETQERTEWHRVVLFNKLAEIAAKYLKKGARIYIEGSLRTRKWQDKSGNDRYTTEIVASDMMMLDSKGTQDSGLSGVIPEHISSDKHELSSTEKSDELDLDSDDIPF